MEYKTAIRARTARRKGISRYSDDAESTDTLADYRSGVVALGAGFQHAPGGCWPRSRWRFVPSAIGRTRAPWLFCGSQSSACAHPLLALYTHTIFSDDNAPSPSHRYATNVIFFDGRAVRACCHFARHGESKGRLRPTPNRPAGMERSASLIDPTPTAVNCCNKRSVLDKWLVEIAHLLIIFIVLGPVYDVAIKL